VRLRTARLPARSPLARATTTPLAVLERDLVAGSAFARLLLSRASLPAGADMITEAPGGPIPSAQLVDRHAACDPRATTRCPVTRLAPHDTVAASAIFATGVRRGDRHDGLHSHHRRRNVADACRCRRARAQPSRGDQVIVRISDKSTTSFARRTHKIMMSACRTIWAYQSRRPVLERLMGRLSPDPRVSRFSNRGWHPSRNHGTVPQVTRLSSR
jgi:hypothetical protein